jgi:hypothetical protein
MAASLDGARPGFMFAQAGVHADRRLRCDMGATSCRPAYVKPLL